MEVRLLETAKEDLRAAWRFYEQQSPGLGDYFLDGIQADSRFLTVFAGVHERVTDYLRILYRRFPSAVYYLIEDRQVDIYSIVDVIRSGSLGVCNETRRRTRMNHSATPISLTIASVPKWWIDIPGPSVAASVRHSV